MAGEVKGNITGGLGGYIKNFLFYFKCNGQSLKGSIKGNCVLCSDLQF